MVARHGTSTVPVSSRVLGADRRSFLGPFIVVIVFLVFAVLLPRIDRAIPWNDPVVAGDEFAVAEEILVAAPAGWEVEAGYRAEDGRTGAETGEARFVGAGVSVDVTSNTFDGTPKQLLEQLEHASAATPGGSFQARGDVTAFTTSSGEAGVMQQFSTFDADGIIAVVVIDGVGVQWSASGSASDLRKASPLLTQSMSSIRAVEQGATS